MKSTIPTVGAVSFAGAALVSSTSRLFLRDVDEPDEVELAVSGTKKPTHDPAKRPNQMAHDIVTGAISGTTHDGAQSVPRDFDDLEGASSNVKPAASSLSTSISRIGSSINSRGFSLFLRTNLARVSTMVIRQDAGSYSNDERRSESMQVDGREDNPRLTQVL